MTQRDVRELKRIEQTDRLPRFMRYLAAITAQELNVAEAARVIGSTRGRSVRIWRCSRRSIWYIACPPGRGI